ncbi:MAG: phosphate/phosphite/phosphonate ABC transporter substrate-binding protein [Clostridia bacterium]|nr:phosphate/phosphite/phosphonate ABC transporter substrate-binding protein [Clostridia bacterium]
MYKGNLLVKLMILIFCLLINVTGCGQTETEVGTENMTKIRLGLAPDEDSAAVLKKYQKFVDYLSEATGLEVEPYVGADYTAVIEALNSGHLDVAWFGPSEYVLATEVVDSGVEAFASAVQAKGTLAYKSSFITRKDSGINSLEDMADRTITFTDPASTSGHIFGRYSLVQEGYNPEEYFKQVIYSGSHDACLLAVANGQVDVAVISSRKLPGFIGKGLVEEDEIQIVFESVEIPADPITYRTDLSEEIKEKLKQAFLYNSIKLKASLEETGFESFSEVNDNAYDLVRNAYEIAGLTPEL